MLTLRTFCVVLITVLLKQTSPATAVDETSFSLQFLAAYCLGFCLLGKACATWTCLKFADGSVNAAWKQQEIYRNAILWLWVGTLPWAYHWGGWQSGLALARQASWPEVVTLALCYLPSIALLASLDLSAVQLEESLLKSRQRGTNATEQLGLGHRWLQVVRLGETGALLTCILPALAIVAINDLWQWWFPISPPWLRGLVTLIALGIVVVAAAPLWMRAMVAAQPFEATSRLPARVAFLCQQLRLPCPTVLGVGSQRAWVGAALVGWIRGARQLWVGKVVCEQLTAAELDMVILHELAHLKRGHCWWRLLPLVMTSLLLAVLVRAYLVPLQSLGLASWLSYSLAGFGLAALILIICGTLGWISRRCELDADRQACWMAGAVCEWAQGQPHLPGLTLARALERLHGPDTVRDSKHWLHPSLAQRCRALEQPCTAQV